MPPIPWDRLFDLLFELIENCDEDAATLRGHHLRIHFGVQRSLRKLGYTGKNLRQARNEVLEEIEDATDKEFDAFVTGGPSAYLALKEG